MTLPLGDGQGAGNLRLRGGHCTCDGLGTGLRAGRCQLPLLRRLLLGGTPEEKPDLYRDRSPITFVQDLKAPLFISAGRNDTLPVSTDRGVRREGWELGKEIEFDVQDAEGHGAGRKRTAIETQLKLLRFLRQRLMANYRHTQPVRQMTVNMPLDTSRQERQT